MNTTFWTIYGSRGVKRAVEWTDCGVGCPDLHYQDGESSTVDDESRLTHVSPNRCRLFAFFPSSSRATSIARDYIRPCVGRFCFGEMSQHVV